FARFIRGPPEQPHPFTDVDHLGLRLDGSSVHRRIGIDCLYPTVVSLPGRCARPRRPTKMCRGSNQSSSVVKPVYGRVNEAIIRINSLIAVNHAVPTEHPLSTKGKCSLLNLPPFDRVVPRILFAVRIRQDVI